MYKEGSRIEYMGRLCIVDKVECNEDNEVLHLLVSPMVDIKDRNSIEPSDIETTI